MWIMAPGGILMPSIRPPETIEAGDKRALQVRARVRSHLDRFRDDYCNDSSEFCVDGGLGPTIASPSMDYQYRAYVSVADLQAGVSAMIAAINYLKFKPSTETFYNDHNLHSAYTRIWGSVLGAFPQPKSLYDGLPSDADLEKLAPAGAYRLPIPAARYKSTKALPHSKGTFGDDDEAFESWLHSHSSPTWPTSIPSQQLSIDDVEDVEDVEEVFDPVEDFSDDDEFLDHVCGQENEVAGSSVLTRYAAVVRSALQRAMIEDGTLDAPASDFDLDPDVTVSEREGLPAPGEEDAPEDALQTTYEEALAILAGSA